MNKTTHCPKCGRTLPPDAPEGLCPRCLAALNLDPETGAPGLGAPGAPPPTAAELGPRFPQLEFLELIGQGGMGVVYKVRQKELDRIAALKILPPGIGLDPAFAERFAREAKALARLNHPGIVTIYDSGRADGLFYFLMEFVDGVSLRRLIQDGRISPREALAIVPQLCDALQYAHDQGIVHRDIKPENILLDRQGRVKVADFGLAKLMGSAHELAASAGAKPSPANLTEAGKVMGTPRYMAPEQRERPAEVDHRADIYALGVVFYQMLTGELPGKFFDPPSTKVQIDVRLDEIVLRALEREPDRRYQQASQVRTDVESVVQTTAPAGVKGEAGSRSPTTPSAPPAAVRFWGLSRRALPGVGAGLVMALVVLIWLRLKQHESVLREVTARGRDHEVEDARAFSNPAGRVAGAQDIVVKMVFATTAVQGDIGVRLDALGTAESSNAVTFAIAEDYSQELIKKFDAHEPLPVEARNRQGELYGRGFLTGIDNQIDTATGTLKCKASLAPKLAGTVMLPGLFLNIRMLIEVKHGVTLVPARAILHDQQGAYVWILDRFQPDKDLAAVLSKVPGPSLRLSTRFSGSVTRRHVQTGARDEIKIEIQGGLSPGEIVASGELEDLREGQKVLADPAFMEGLAEPLLMGK